MKKTSRVATACIAGALATGMLTVPASAQSAYMEPTTSSQAVGDAIVGSAELPFRTLFPLAQGTPLEAPVLTTTVMSAMPFMVVASLFSKQCNLGDTRGCYDPR